MHARDQAKQDGEENSCSEREYIVLQGIAGVWRQIAILAGFHIRYACLSG